MFILSFIRSLLADHTWKYRVPLLISLPYFFIGLGGIGGEATTVGFLASLCTIVGFLSIRSLINDWVNRGKDTPSVQKSVSSNWSRSVFYLVLLCSVLLALIPWMYLPIDAYSSGVIGVEIGLFCLFTFRPFRFNSSSVLGVVLGAGYAYVIPVVLASYTIYLFTGKSFVLIKEFLVLLVIWQFVSGLRNLLHHQVENFKKDPQNDPLSFVQTVGVDRTKIILKWVLIPLEGVCFVGFLALALNFYWFTWIIAPLGVFVGLVQIYKRRKSTELSFLKKITRFLLDDLYVIYLPLIPLSGLFFVELSATVIIVTHLLIFPSLIKRMLTTFTNWLHGTRIKQWLFGYSSYLKGIVVHLLIAFVYLAVFSLIYFWLKNNAES
ncbi:MAG: hypothetical protein AB8B56_17300, partial [Crocinitomicaceae bacterium]